MGLFLGFSFLSIAECVYYAVIHPCRAVRRYHTSNDLEMALPQKVHSVSQRLKNKRNLLKNRYRKSFAISQTCYDKKPPSERKIKVPYRITYGFDVPIDDNIQLPYCE